MRIVVTGGAGFIGSHVVDALRETGHEVVIVDVLDPSAHHASPDWLHDDVELRREDVRDPAMWRDVLRGTDAVCHQAARVGLGVDAGDVLDYVGTNDVGTAQMLWSMNDAGWRGRIVLASSMVVYGEGRYRCDDHGIVRPPPRAERDLAVGLFDPRCPSCGRTLRGDLVDEGAPTDPRNTYAATKTHQEHLCSSFARETGSEVIALRYHNVYGARMPRDTPYAGVASRFRSSLEADERPRVFEDGGQLRDFVHVSDVAAANMAALTHPGPLPAAVNVASGHPTTLLEMARRLADADGRGIDPEVTGEYRLGDVRHVVGDPTLASEVLGFRAATTPDVGLTRFAHEPLRPSLSSGSLSPTSVSRTSLSPASLPPDSRAPTP